MSERKPEQSTNRSPSIVAAVLEHQRGDVAARRILADLDHFAFGALDPDAEAELAHERAEQRGVELVGVAVGRGEALVLGRRPEPVGQRRLDRERIGADRLGAALALQLEPVVVEADPGDFLAEAAERVDVAFADAGRNRGSRCPACRSRGSPS